MSLMLVTNENGSVIQEYLNNQKYIDNHQVFNKKN